MNRNSLLKYSCVGIINSAFGYAIIFIFIYIGMTPELSNFFGYFISVLLSFYLNKYISFNDPRRDKKQIFKFIFSMAIAYIVNLLIMSFFYRICEVNVYISQLLGGFTYFLTGYILSKKWVFCTRFKAKVL